MEISIEDREKTAKKTAITSVALNIVFALAKGIAGIFGNSFALIADAIESLSDVFSSILVFLGIKYAIRPADENHPYGHGKIEPLITFIIVVILIISSVTIFYNALENLNIPNEKPKVFTIYVLIAVVIAKELMYRYVEKKGDETQSTSLFAEAWHHRSDAISSAMALLGIIISIYGGFEQADEYAAMVTAVIILINAYLIFRPALAEIMDEHRYIDLENELRIFIKKEFTDTDTEKICIRKHGMYYYVDLHLIVNGKMTVFDGHNLAHQVKNKIKGWNTNIADVLIHVEPDDHDVF